MCRNFNIKSIIILIQSVIIKFLYFSDNIYFIYTAETQLTSFKVYSNYCEPNLLSSLYQYALIFNFNDNCIHYQDPRLISYKLYDT